MGSDKRRDADTQPTGRIFLKLANDVVNGTAFRPSHGERNSQVPTVQESSFAAVTSAPVPDHGVPVVPGEAPTPRPSNSPPR